ncbi:hypothetical protein QEN19_004303 [Hanseniaspora menglaensis]
MEYDSQKKLDFLNEFNRNNSEDSNFDLNGKLIHHNPVDIPNIKQLSINDKIAQNEDSEFISPRTPPFTPTNNSFLLFAKSKQQTKQTNDLLSTTPNEDDLMSELSKLLTDKLPEDDLPLEILSPDSSSLNLLSNKSMLRKSPGIPWHEKSSPVHNNKNLNLQSEVCSNNSNDTLTRDEDGNNSVHEEDENPNLFLQIDEIDGLPLTASPNETNTPQSDDYRKLSPSSRSPKLIPRNIINFPTAEDQDKNSKQVKFKNQKKPILKMEDMDYNIPVNIKLDNELKKKANQISFSMDKNFAGDEATDFTPINKAILDWEYYPYSGFICEMNNWFLLLEGCSDKHDLIDEVIWFVKDEKTKNRDIEMDVLKFNDLDFILPIFHKSLGEFVGLCMGDEDCFNDESLQLEYLVKNILVNNFELIEKHGLSMVLMLKQHMSLVMTETNRNIITYNKLVKISSTIFFIMVSSCLDYLNKIDENALDKNVFEQIQNFKMIIEHSDFLSFLMDYIENWRFTFKIGMQIRQMLVLFDKLIILQFGNNKELVKTRIELQKQLNSDYKESNFGSSMNSAYYEALRQDLITRFPELTNKIDLLDEYKFDLSQSTVQFINVPRPKKDHITNMIANGKNVSQLDNNNIPNIQVIGSQEPTPYSTPRSSFSRSENSKNIGKKSNSQTNLNIPFFAPSNGIERILNPFNDVITILNSTKKHQDYNSLQLSYNKLKLFCHEMKLNDFNETDVDLFFNNPKQKDNLERIEKFYASNFKKLKSLVVVINKIISNLDVSQDTHLILISTSLSIILHLLERLKLQHILKYEYFSEILFKNKFVEISTGLLDYTYSITDRFKMIFYNEEEHKVFSYLLKFVSFDEKSEYKIENNDGSDKIQIVNKSNIYDGNKDAADSEDINVNYLNFEYTLLQSLNLVISNKTQRLKFLPLNIGVLFKKNYQIFNKSMYKPVLEIIKQLTPFKSKKWKAEHMELITGVYMHLNLNILDNNWVTGKDTNGEIIDSSNIEFAMGELVRFYNKSNYNV